MHECRVSRSQGASSSHAKVIAARAGYSKLRGKLLLFSWLSSSRSIWLVGEQMHFKHQMHLFMRLTHCLTATKTSMEKLFTLDYSTQRWLLKEQHTCNRLAALPLSKIAPGWNKLASSTLRTLNQWDRGSSIADPEIESFIWNDRCLSYVSLISQWLPLKHITIERMTIFLSMLSCVKVFFSPSESVGELTDSFCTCHLVRDGFSSSRLWVTVEWIICEA